MTAPILTAEKGGVVLNELIPPHTGCQNCGDCCGMIPATTGEIRRIFDFMQDKPDVKEFAIKHGNRPLSCPFRNNHEKKCMVYPVRPTVCRLMGVCRGMKCSHGNSANIDGHPFIAGVDINEVAILNEIDWSEVSL